MKTAKEILSEKYAKVGAYNMDDTHRIAAMEEYANQFKFNKLSNHQLLIQYVENWNTYAYKTHILSIEENYDTHFDGFESRVTLYSQLEDISKGYDLITHKVNIASGCYSGEKINYEECYKVIVKDVFLAGFDKLIEISKTL